MHKPTLFFCANLLICTLYSFFYLVTCLFLALPVPQWNFQNVKYENEHALKFESKDCIYANEQSC